MNLWHKALNVVRRAVTPQEFMIGADLEGIGGRRFVHPYAQSVWVQAAINIVTQPIKSIPLKFYRGDVEFEDAAVRSFWRQPAAGMSYEEFIDASCGWLKLSGEFFWILDDSWLVRGGTKSRLLVARPDEMREVVVGGELLGWEYRDANHQRHPLIAEQVVQVKRWNPYNRHRGLGELESALVASEADYFAGNYARNSWANMGEQGDYIFAKAGMPSVEQQEQVTAALRAKRAAKLRGDFRPVFLTSDLDFKSPQVSGLDAGMVANRLQSRHEVFIAFGVPASMADVVASYSVGSASDFFRLVHSTCMPLAKMLAGAMGRLVRAQTGQDVEAFFDWDEHPTMQAVRNERIEAAKNLWGMGMPMSKVNEYLDMGLPEFAGWELSYVPFSLEAVGEGLDVTGGTPVPPVPEMDDEVALMVRALKGCPAHGKLEISEDKGAGDLWQAHWRSRQETIKTYASKFNKQLMLARSQVLAKVERFKGVERDVTGGTPVPPVQRAAAGDLNFNLEEWQDGLIVEFDKAGRAALNKAGRQAKAEIGLEDDAWTMPPPKAVSFLQGRRNFLRDIADAIHQEIESQLVEGLNGGETMQELADRVRGTFNGISRERAMRIAMTETAAAYGAARQEALEQSGIEWKQWLTSGNDNVRPSHELANGQRRRINEPFTVGGASLMHPSDGSLGAPPEEVINCHCVSIAAEGPGKSKIGDLRFQKAAEGEDLKFEQGADGAAEGDRVSAPSPEIKTPPARFAAGLQCQGENQ